MNIRDFFGQFHRWPAIRAVPPSVSAATSTVRYFRAGDLPSGVAVTDVEFWRIDAIGREWFRIVEGRHDV